MSSPSVAFAQKDDSVVSKMTLVRKMVSEGSEAS